MVQENTKTEVTEVKGSLTYEDKVIQKIVGLALESVNDEPDLTAAQKARLECVANTSETLWEAYKLKERLRIILRQTADEAGPIPRQWAADAPLSGIGEFSRLGEKTAAASTSCAPSGPDYPTPGSRPSTTRSKLPSGPATATGTSTTSSAWSCPNAAD